MKCPKCGFNSFEYYDMCKKCSADLIGYKQTYSITALVLPLEAKEKLAAESQSAESVTDQTIENVETHDDIFSFDLPDDAPSPSIQSTDDPFNFDAPLPEVKQPVVASPSEDDVFADLLESTSQAEESPFAAPGAGAPAAVSAVQSADSSSGPGEFDLESFSWDDTPVGTAAPGAVDAEVTDDFDSLFGDMKDTAQK